MAAAPSDAILCEGAAGAGGLTGGHRILSRAGGKEQWRRADRLYAEAQVELRTPDGWAAPTRFVVFAACDVYEVRAGDEVLCRASAGHRLALADGTLCRVGDLRPGTDTVTPLAFDDGPQRLPITEVRQVSAGAKTYSFDLPGGRFAAILLEADGPAHWAGAASE